MSDIAYKRLKAQAACFMKDFVRIKGSSVWVEPSEGPTTFSQHDRAHPISEHRYAYLASGPTAYIGGSVMKRRSIKS